jgi:alpha-ketoglutarate-dependent taurine dioxygenase
MNTKPIEYFNMQDLETNIKYFGDKFKEDGILVFRNANLNEADQRRVQEIFGDYFGIFPNSQESFDQLYIENHTALLENNVSGDQLMLGWHMEHLYMSNPIVVGFWNMYKFLADSNTGKTFFYDSRTLYKLIPDDWKDFLASCVIDASLNVNVLDDTNHTSAISRHWLTNDYMIRIPLHDIGDDPNPLVYFAGLPASNEQKDQYEEITKGIKELLLGDTFRTFEHKWKQGDLVIVDIHSMLHAVSGGFDPADREFRGMWSYAEKFIKPIGV